ncbi:hypothetical protein OWP16_04550 [Bacillus paranthracis]|uniref:hypothetical protein n=1 Tax=Bacillus paranthracis TaxID=2026186 RepID=UPI00254FE57A|nr:hypothetical protein [Bacillus paranthracis]MDK7419256.1 hypothetical protein [Bacillus paranthracis]MDK7430879.1 hypothetical protein [Bacillus paranthracis]MDK7516556.1 hypothetical protein [Bacillus paranthracis]MDK7572390.1 hypothetical protein [Bacillus paranthracis]
MAFVKVICIQGFSIARQFGEKAEPPASYAPGQVYEIDSVYATKYKNIGFMIDYNSTMFNNPKLPSKIRTDVIRIG